MNNLIRLIADTIIRKIYCTLKYVCQVPSLDDKKKLILRH